MREREVLHPFHVDPTRQAQKDLNVKIRHGERGHSYRESGKSEKAILARKRLPRKLGTLNVSCHAGLVPNTARSGKDPLAFRVCFPARGLKAAGHIRSSPQTDVASQVAARLLTPATEMHGGSQRQRSRGRQTRPGAKATRATHTPATPASAQSSMATTPRTPCRIAALHLF